MFQLEAHESTYFRRTFQDSDRGGNSARTDAFILHHEPTPDVQRTVTAATYAGAPLAVAGTLARVTGRPLVFPSLGPSAYLLAARGRRPTANCSAGGTVAARLIASTVVSLGLLPTLADALVIAVGVSGLYAASAVADRSGLSPSER